jgi:hypothetical protein
MAEGILFFILFCIVLHLIDRVKDLDRKAKKIDSKISALRTETAETYSLILAANNHLDVLSARLSQ